MQFGADRMEIIKERTRIIFSDYNTSEKNAIEDMVATMDKVFTYEDSDKHMICLPTGMENATKRLFPRHNIIDKSKEYWPYNNMENYEINVSPRNQLQKDFISFMLDNMNKKQKSAGILSVGTGKGIPNFVKIPSPNSQGYIRMGDIKVGDYVFGSDGKPTEVIGVFPQGKRKCYKITFNDGRTALCDENHLWSYYNWGMRLKTKSISDMIKDFKKFDVYLDKRNKEQNKHNDPYEYKYKIPLLSSPVEYQYQEVPINPYVLGAFIGNGCCTCHPLEISSGDDFVPKKIAKICGFSFNKRKGTYSYHFRNAQGNLIHTKDFFKDIPEMINCYSRDKIIPDTYLYNSYEVRMELLRGLMDTDGSISATDGIRYNVRYSSCSKKLLEQMQQLIYGLGYFANFSQDKRVDKYVNGYHGNMNVRVPQKFKRELFTHPRKLHIAEKAYKYGSDWKQPFKYLIIKNIEEVQDMETTCIKVDAEDELFLTEDYIVTHNTFMACYCATKFRAKTLIIVPTSAIKFQWADTLTGMFKIPKDRVVTVNAPTQFINVNADFVIVSQATLASLNKSYDLEKIMKDNRFGFKVIDEVQMWFHNIIKVDGCSNIANNLYLTGTFGRSGEDENRLYQEMFGDISIFREKEKKPSLFDRKPGNIYGMKPHTNFKMYWGNSRLPNDLMKKVTSAWKYSDRSDKWTRIGINMAAYVKLVFPDDGHNTPLMQALFKIIQIALNEINYGKTLILMPSIASAEMIAKYMRQRYPNLKTGTLHSKNPKSVNAENKKNCDCLVSTVPSAGTGFDWKGLSRLINASPYKSWIIATQVRGRLRILDSGKDTYMYELVDARIPQLRRWANVRSQVYRKECKTFKVIDMK